MTITTAYGWAVYANDGIDMRTVSETRRSAIVNWLCVTGCVLIHRGTTDEQIELIWQDRRGEARAIPVRVEGSPMPIRIQRKRTKGWRCPPNTIYVGRPTVWGNPYGKDEAGLACYRENAKGCLPIEQLRGKDLACWCGPDVACHADVLLQLANA